MLKYPKTLVINGAPTPADAAQLRPGDEITAWEDGVPQKYVKDAAGGLVVPFSGTAATNAAQIAAQEAADAGNALLPQMQAKIVAVDTTIAGAQATVAGLVADTEQSKDAIAATANSVPYANLAAFPASSTATKGAIALDTGNVYAPGGQTWGNPIGTVPTGAAVVAADAKAVAAQASFAGLDAQRGLSAATLNIHPDGGSTSGNAAAIADLTAQLVARGQTTLHLEGKTYTLPATLKFERASAGLIGTGMATWIAETDGAGTKIIVPEGVAQGVVFRGKSGTIPPPYSLPYRWGSARLGGLTLTGAGAAAGQEGIAFEMGNGPGSPISLADFRVRGFKRGIVSRVPQGMSTGVVGVTLTGAVIHECEYGIYGDEAVGTDSGGDGMFGNVTLMGGVIKHNLAGGVRIKNPVAVGVGGLYGSFEAGGMLFEGQPNPWELEGGLANVHMRSLYLEANTGRNRLKFTRWDASATIEPQYVHASPELYNDFEVGLYRVRDSALPYRIQYGTLLEFAPTLLGIKPSSAEQITLNALHPSVLRGRSAPNTYAVREQGSGSYRQTPFGVQKMRGVAGASTPFHNTRVTATPTIAAVVNLLVENNSDVLLLLGCQWWNSTETGLITEVAQAIVIPPRETRVVSSVLSGVAGSVMNPHVRLTLETADGSTPSVRIGPGTEYAAPVAQPSATAAQRAHTGVPLFYAPGRGGVDTTGLTHPAITWKSGLANGGISNASAGWSDGTGDTLYGYATADVAFAGTGGATFTLPDLPGWTLAGAEWGALNSSGTGLPVATSPYGPRADRIINIAGAATYTVGVQTVWVRA